MVQYSYVYFYCDHWHWLHLRRESISCLNFYCEYILPYFWSQSRGTKNVGYILELLIKIQWRNWVNAKSVSSYARFGPTTLSCIHRFQHIYVIGSPRTLRCLVTFFYFIWATSWQNQQNYMWAQRRLRSAWASAQSDQSIRCSHEETSSPYSYLLSAQRRLWSDWADAQADLSLRWARMSVCWFCHAVAHFFFKVFY